MRSNLTVTSECVAPRPERKSRVPVGLSVLSRVKEMLPKHTRVVDVHIDRSIDIGVQSRASPSDSVVFHHYRAENVVSKLDQRVIAD